MTRRILSTYLFGNRRYRVTSAVVIVPRLSGGEVYVYRNGLLPADTRPSTVQMLLKLDAIQETQDTQENQ